MQTGQDLEVPFERKSLRFGGGGNCLIEAEGYCNSLDLYAVFECCAVKCALRCL